MKKSPQPIGKLGLSPRFEPHLPPYKPSVESARNQNLAKVLIGSKNKVVEGLGKGLRSFFNTIDVDSAMPTTNTKVNRRAGRTALASTLIISGIVALGFNLVSHDENTTDSPTNEEQCFTFALQDFGSDANSAQVASMISDIENSGQVLRNTDRYDEIVSEFSDLEPVMVCGDAVEKVAARTVDNS